MNDMATITLPAETLQEALDACVPALRQMLNFQLDPTLARRINTMGERKEFLNEEEHAELLALVQFTQQRTIERLQAELALQRLRTAFPQHMGAA